MTDDRKRLLVSIAAAVLLNFTVLILTGLTSFNYQVPERLKPADRGDQFYACALTGFGTSRRRNFC